MGNSSSETVEEIPVHDPWRRQAHLNIRSTKMPPFRNNRWLGIFLDLVQEDLNRITCDKITNDNLLPDERVALKELSEAPNLLSLVTREAMWSSFLSRTMNKKL